MNIKSQHDIRYNYYNINIIIAILNQIKIRDRISIATHDVYPNGAS